MPAIRTHQWLMMYGSLYNACRDHSWELVLVSPFDLPEEMKHFVYETGDNLFKSQMNQQKLVDKHFTQLAQDNGWNPSHIVGNYASVTPQQNQFTDAHFQKLDQELGKPAGTAKSLYLQKIAQQKNGGG